MNLVLLVEGAETEPRVYRTWLGHRTPALRPVQDIAALTDNGYVLVSGKGYPSCYRRIAGIVQDIKAHPGKVDEFWLCLDSDEDSYEDRLAEADRAVREEADKADMKRCSPSLVVRIIVQHCCIETWFLGHDGFLRSGPQGRDLVEFKRFYDVSDSDPEYMGTFPGYVTRASFHLAYLKAMMAERGRSYTKRHPGIVLEPSYLTALEERCSRTGHLTSLSRLFEAFRSIG